LFDQQTCPFRSGFGFVRSISFDVHEGVYQRDQYLNLLAT
jgi:hypothetical protein